MKKISVQTNPKIEQIRENSIKELMLTQCIQQKMQEYNLNKEDLEENWIDFLQYALSCQECVACTKLSDCPKVTKGMKQDIQGMKGNLHFPLSPCVFGLERFENQDILNRIALKNVGDKILLTRSKDLSILKQTQGNAKQVVTMLGEYVKNPTGKGIYLYGMPGTGKSTVMGWLMRALVLEGKQCGFVHLPTFLSDIKETFNNHGSDARYVELMKNIDYLVIDDIGGESVSAWSRDEILSSILGYRAQNEKTTFFTSVYPLPELKKYYFLKSGDTMKVERLIDRMKAVSNSIQLIGQDLR